jgi:hypothetical protein
MSDDAVVAVGTLAIAGALAALAIIDSTLAAMVVSVAAGAAWLLCLSTFNIASQQAVPGWVRARGLALYLSAFMGGIAVGSAGWGVVADAVGSQTAFAWGALTVTLTLLLRLRRPLRFVSDLDLSPSPMFAPEMRLEPRDASGPVFVDTHLRRPRRCRRRVRRRPRTSPPRATPHGRSPVGRIPRR